MITLAISTSAERGVLLALRCRHVELVQDASSGRYTGRIILSGTTTRTRKRTVDVADSICRRLLPFLEGKTLHDRVFGRTAAGDKIDQYKVRYWFDQAREKAGLPGLRFHDLRAVFSHAGEEAGIPLTIMQRCMGHATPEMTAGYQWRQAVLGSEGAEKIAAQLGLTG